MIRLIKHNQIPPQVGIMMVIILMMLNLSQTMIVSRAGFFQNLGFTDSEQLALLTRAFKKMLMTMMMMITMTITMTMAMTMTMTMTMTITMMTMTKMR